MDNTFKKGLAVGMLLGGGGGNVGPKSVTANGTYSAFNDGLDGYDVVTVSVEPEEVEFTENGRYTAQNDGGYSPVIVSVETYEEELAAALEKIDELEEEIEDCEEKCDTVVDTIKDLNPSWDYPDPLDPDRPPTAQELKEGIEGASGYEFPAGTVYDPDIINMVAGDNVTDETLGYTLYSEIGMNYDPQHQAWHNPYLKWGMVDSNGVYHQFWAINYGSAAPMFTVESYCITNSATGAWAITYIDPYGNRQTDTGTSQDLIGFGDTGHTYKVHKSVPQNV